MRARSLSVRALGLRSVSVLAGAGVVSSAHAAGPLGSNGAPITTSAYSIDLYQGAVSAGNRVMGLGGAYVALAEDVDGDLQNPAAPAVRPFFSIDHFDYWLGLGLTFVGGFLYFGAWLARIAEGNWHQCWPDPQFRG